MPKTKTLISRLPSEAVEAVAMFTDSELLDELAALGPSCIDQGQYGFDVSTAGMEFSAADLKPERLGFEVKGLTFRDAIRAAVLLDALQAGL